MRWMEGVYGHVLSMADVDRDELHAVVKQKVGERRFSDAAARLRGLVITYKSYDFVPKLFVEEGIFLGPLTGVTCTRFSLQAICKVLYGGLPLARARAHYDRKEQLIAAGICDDLRRVCLFCLLTRNICVMESEWHFIFHCPLYTDLRTGSLFRRRAAEVGSEHCSFPRPYSILFRTLPLCIKEPALANQLGSFIRLSLRVREGWLEEAVRGGLHIGPIVCNNAHVYCNTVEFANGVASSL